MSNLAPGPAPFSQALELYSRLGEAPHLQRLALATADRARARQLLQEEDARLDYDRAIEWLADLVQERPGRPPRPPLTRSASKWSSPTRAELRSTRARTNSAESAKHSAATYIVGKENFNRPLSWMAIRENQMLSLRASPHPREVAHISGCRGSYEGLPWLRSDGIRQGLPGLPRNYIPVEDEKLEQALKYVAIRMGDQANDLHQLRTGVDSGFKGVSRALEELSTRVQELSDEFGDTTGRMEARSREMQVKLEEVLGHLEEGARGTGSLRARVERIEKHLGLEAS